ncbi:LOW QUALITY PROTEIN: thaumatin-like protein [Asparagus officinalis]|uniref:LOW QUALITY PROTEIN: thaumatin-like protein n=1 Tax=Asparagus officinalis TaxID=4686 RepID=UPI00098E6E40|nr:LOW QUALITY PROTEIN: thaumatin-like protein [Asparagus officinalis]
MHYTVWAAAVAGGRSPPATQPILALTVAPGTPGAASGANRLLLRPLWPGHCQTGDCGGLLACTPTASPPDTSQNSRLNQYAGQDFYDISLVDGFNIPMDFSPTSGNCHDIRCTADINGQCPAELKAPGGCNNPCTVFKTNEYCCTSGGCGPTDYSKFFKQRCPDAYSYPKDDATSTFTCPSGADYRVVFCP